MRIDRTHEPWAIATAAIFAFSFIAYTIYARNSMEGPRGDSVMGLVFGSVGFGMMLFATLLSLRKKFPVWRIGRAQTWMRGHLWLGLLSYPIILFHAGFSWGGTLTSVMMWIFTFVIISGIVGAVLQHFMPRLITQRVPMETIYDQIDRVQGQLLTEADELIASIDEIATKLGLYVAAAKVGSSATMPKTGTTPEVAVTELRGVYTNSIRPFLAVRGAYRDPLYARKNAKGMFSRLRKLTPEELKDVVDDLENVCEEKRDLDRQSRMHRALHVWLFIHLPLSFALIALGFIHAVWALRY
jgi:hypothetical protein